MLIVLSLPRTALTWSAVATTESMKRSMFTADARKLRVVAVDRLVVGVARDVVDLVVGLLEHDPLPRRRTSASARSSCRTRRVPASGSTCRIARAVLTASWPYSRGVPWPSCQGPSISLPRHHIRMSYGSTAPFAMRWSDSSVPDADVRVLEHVERLLHSAGAEVDGVHELAVDLLRASSANSSRPTSFVSVECQARSRRRGRSSRGPTPSSQRYPETKLPPGYRIVETPSSRTSSITSLRIPVLVGVGVTGLVDAVVDAPPEVLDEGAEQAAIDGPDDEVRVDGEMCGDHGSSFVESMLGWVDAAGYLRLPMASPPRQ